MTEAGRPTKYKEEMCDRIIELFKEGYSICEICLDLDISKQTFYRWKEENRIFSDSIKKGVDFSQGWWEKQGREGLFSNNDPMSNKINPTVWFMNMKNRFQQDWRDKHEVEVETESNKTEYEVRKSLYE